MNEDLDNSWNQEGVDPIILDLEVMTPKQLLKVIQLIKLARCRNPSFKLSFSSESHLATFKKLLKEQEEIELDMSRREGPLWEQKRNNPDLRDFMKKKHLVLTMESFLHSAIFLKHYDKRLKQITKQHDVEFKQNITNIMVVSDKKISDMLQSELSLMKSRIVVCLFRNRPDIDKLMRSSKYAQEKLKKLGIFFFLDHNKHRTMNPAFYSTEFSRERAGLQIIRKAVLDEVSLAPKILDLSDPNLAYTPNKIIFDLLQKNLIKVVEQIKSLYQIVLQENKPSTCYVLHSQNQVFAQEPIEILSKRISNIFFFSFDIKDSRSYANQFRKDASKTQFIKVSHKGRKFYCCVDRSRIKEKKVVLNIFKGYLEELSSKSELKIYLYYNSILAKDSILSDQIIDLAYSHHLEITNMMEINEKTSHTIIIKPKNAVQLDKNQQKIERAQYQLTNFLLGLLMLEQKEKMITAEEISETLSFDVDREKQPRIMRKKSERSTRSVIQQNKNEMKQNLIDKEFGCTVQFEFVEPQDLEEGQIKKGSTHNQLKDLLYEQQTLTFKVQRLAVCKKLFGFTDKTALDCSKGYLVKNILEDGKPLQRLEPKPFTSMEVKQSRYLVYISPDRKMYLPTHLITRRI